MSYEATIFLAHQGSIMCFIRILIAGFLTLFTVDSYARSWPGTFTRQTYHTFYVESKVIDNMPFNIQGFNYQAGKPAVLNFITAYTQFGLHPQNTVNPPRYSPSITCHFKGNIPIYDQWTFILATDIEQPKRCN